MSTFRWTGADLINLSQTKELLERWGLALTLNLYINCYYGKDYKSTWACVTTIMWGGGDVYRHLLLACGQSGIVYCS